MPEKLTTRRVTAIVSAMKPLEVRDSAARGLVLRVRPGGWAWSVRRTLAKTDRRLDLGNAWSLDEAREIADEVDRRIRSGLDPWTEAPAPWQEWYAPRLRAKLGLPEPVIPPPMPAESRGRPDLPALYWAEAVDLWLAEVARTRKSRTVPAYRKALAVLEMRRFRDWKVAAVTRQEAAEAIAAIAKRGRERQAETTATAVRGLFAFLSRYENTRLSGVEEGRMERLRAPPRSIAADDGDVGDNAGSGHVPDGPMVGHLVRGLRRADSETLERDRLAALLVVYTVQRRLTVACARKREFAPVGDGRGVWTIPALHRKAGSGEIRKGRKPRPHVIPLPPSAWAVVRAAMALYPDSEWLFPAVREWRAGVPVTHVNEAAVTRAFSDVAGNPCSPHDMRRALSTTYKREARIPAAACKLLLDHNEGFDSNDVTRRHYDFDDLLDDKWPVASGYAAWVDKWAATRD